MVVYVRDTLSCKRTPDLELYSVESVWIELQVKSKRVFIVGFTGLLSVTKIILIQIRRV